MLPKPGNLAALTGPDVDQDREVPAEPRLPTVWQRDGGDAEDEVALHPDVASATEEEFVSDQPAMLWRAKLRAASRASFSSSIRTLRSPVGSWGSAGYAVFVLVAAWEIQCPAPGSSGKNGHMDNAAGLVGRLMTAARVAQASEAEPDWDAYGALAWETAKGESGETALRCGLELLESADVLEREVGCDLVGDAANEHESVRREAATALIALEIGRAHV